MGSSRRRPVHIWLLGAGLCAAPVSIAVSEILLGGALVCYLIAIARGQAAILLPRVFRVWLLWAALLTITCVSSGALSKGGGELRHLGLIAALFFLLPSLDREPDRLAVWRGIFVVGSASALVLVARFVFRLLWYRGGLDPVVYLRGGGLLHHWMVFATVEVVIFAGLLEFWRYFPEERRWLVPVLVLHAAAILFSLTRTLWLCCLRWGSSSCGGVRAGFGRCLRCRACCFSWRPMRCASASPIRANWSTIRTRNVCRCCGWDGE